MQELQVTQKNNFKISFSDNLDLNKINFNFNFDFDENGALFWLGTQGKTKPY